MVELSPPPVWIHPSPALPDLQRDPPLGGVRFFIAAGMGGAMREPVLRIAKQRIKRAARREDFEEKTSGYHVHHACEEANKRVVRPGCFDRIFVAYILA